MQFAKDDVRFESPEGTRLWQCPKCITGRLVERNTDEGAHVIRCSSYLRYRYRA